jgi:hypothetical protein
VKNGIHVIRMCGEEDACLCGFMDCFQLMNWAENRNILSAKGNRGWQYFG